MSFLLGVVHKGRLQGVGLAQMRTNGEGGLIACGRPQLTRPIALLAVLACSCTAFLVTRTVTAVAVLSGPLTFYNVRLLSLALWSVAWIPCIS